MLEFLLVVAVMSVITIMGLSLIQRLRVRAQGHQVQTQVASLLTALQRYYRAHCLTDWTYPFGNIKVTAKELEKEGLLKAGANLHNPWGHSYEMEIMGSKRPIRLHVKASFTRLPGATPAHFRRLLAAGGTGFELSWTTVPSQFTRHKTATDLWPLSSHLFAFNLKLDKDHESNACISA